MSSLLGLWRGDADAGESCGRGAAGAGAVAAVEAVEPAAGSTEAEGIETSTASKTRLPGAVLKFESPASSRAGAAAAVAGSFARQSVDSADISRRALRTWLRGFGPGR